MEGLTSLSLLAILPMQPGILVCFHAKSDHDQLGACPGPRSLSAELLCSQDAACGGRQWRLADADGHTGHSQRDLVVIVWVADPQGLVPIKPIYL